MKHYEKPEAIWISLCTTDVITSSPTIDDNNDNIGGIPNEWED